ncbi:MFS transporter, partial [Streptomyces hainanensis]
MDLATRRRQRSLFVFFLLPGIAISSWVTRTPDIRDQLEASTAQMGLVLFGLSVGSMIGILSSGALVSRLGTRPVIGIGTTLVVVSMAVIGCGALIPSAPVVTAGLALFGAGMGSGEVAVNIDGARVESLTGRTVLPTLHGFFSLGTVAGASLGILSTAVEFPVHWHLLAIAVLAALLFAAAYGAIPAGVGKRAGGAGEAGDGTGSG